jgi:hypothetical protein
MSTKLSQNYNLEEREVITQRDDECGYHAPWNGTISLNAPENQWNKLMNNKEMFNKYMTIAYAIIHDERIKSDPKTAKKPKSLFSHEIEILLENDQIRDIFSKLLGKSKDALKYPEIFDTYYNQGFINPEHTKEMQFEYNKLSLSTTKLGNFLFEKSSGVKYTTSLIVGHLSHWVAVTILPNYISLANVIVIQFDSLNTKKFSESTHHIGIILSDPTKRSIFSDNATHDDSAWSSSLPSIASNCGDNQIIVKTQSVHLSKKTQKTLKKEQEKNKKRYLYDTGMKNVYNQYGETMPSSGPLTKYDENKNIEELLDEERTILAIRESEKEYLEQIKKAQDDSVKILWNDLLRETNYSNESQSRSAMTERKRLEMIYKEIEDEIDNMHQYHSIEIPITL